MPGALQDGDPAEGWPAMLEASPQTLPVASLTSHACTCDLAHTHVRLQVCEFTLVKKGPPLREASRVGSAAPLQRGERVELLGRAWASSVCRQAHWEARRWGRLSQLAKPEPQPCHQPELSMMPLLSDQ